MKVIGIAGEKGVGKSTFARLIQEQIKNSHVEISPMAAPIYRWLQIQTGKSIEYIKNNKETQMPNTHYTYRHALQMYAELQKAINGDKIWVKTKQNELSIKQEQEDSLNQNTVILIDDIRFPYELEMVKSLDGITVYLERPTANTDTHISENSLSKSDAYIDFVIQNHRDIEYLRIQTQILVETQIQN